MLPLGCRSLDGLLGGGLPEKIITQIYGPAGSGKTNICLQALCNAARANKKAIYIDTESGFSEKRLEQIAGGLKDKVLSITTLIEPQDFAGQEKAILSLRKERAGLVIVDSAVSLYRLELEDERASEVNRNLGRQLRALLDFAQDNNAVVLVTNQVYSDFKSDGGVEPVGGDVLKYSSKVIVELSKEGDGIRRALLRKHAFRREGESVLFKIVEKGLADCDGAQTR